MNDLARRPAPCEFREPVEARYCGRLRVGVIVGFVNVRGVLQMIVVIVMCRVASGVGVMRVAEGAECVVVRVGVTMGMLVGVDEIPVPMLV